MEELMIYEGQRAIAEAKRSNYEVTSPMTGQKTELKRGTDFGVIPGTKKPSLYKAGAEKVILAYGLLQHYEVLSQIENWDGDRPFFMYTIRCDLVRVAGDGKEYVFTSGLGSANSAESSNGYRKSAYDNANSSLKKACKRAMVAAAINIGGLSSLFSQDMDDEDFMKGYDAIVNSQDGNSKITAKQIKRLFAIAAEAGYNAQQAKQKLAAAGYTETKEITQDQYDTVCKIFEGGGKE